MEKEKIKETGLYKELSKMSNSDRGLAFEKHKDGIEKTLSVDLIKHSYANIAYVSTDNPILSYQDRWASATGAVIAIMEFKPKNNEGL